MRALKLLGERKRFIGLSVAAGTVTGIVLAASNAFGPNPNFGSSGLGTPLSSTSYGVADAVDRNDPSDPNDHIYSLVSAYPDNNGSGGYIGPYYIVRRNSDGTIDSSFGNGSPLSFPNSTSNSFQFRGLCLDPATHAIVVVGSQNSTQGGSTMIAERMVLPPTSGSATLIADSTFNQTGMVSVAPATNKGANGQLCRVGGNSVVTLFGNEGGYTAGSSSGSTQTSGNLLLAKFQSNGTAVSSFGTAGVARPQMTLTGSSGAALYPGSPNSVGSGDVYNPDFIIVGDARDATGSKTSRQALLVGVNRCTGALDSTNFNGTGFLLNPSYDSTSFGQGVLAHVLGNGQFVVLLINQTSTGASGDLVTLPYPLAANATPVTTSGVNTISFPQNTQPSGSLTQNSAGNLPLGLNTGTNQQNVYEFLGQANLGFSAGARYGTCGGSNTVTFTDNNSKPVTMAITSPASATFGPASAVPQPASASGTGASYPNGWFSYSIQGLAAGGTATVAITLPAGSAPTGYAKVDKNGAYSTLPASAVSIAGNVITLTLTDGGTGDSDLTANGTITDPGAPIISSGSGSSSSGGSSSSSSSGGSSSSSSSGGYGSSSSSSGGYSSSSSGGSYGGGGGGGGAVAPGLLALLGLAAAARRRRRG